MEEPLGLPDQVACAFAAVHGALEWSTCDPVFSFGGDIVDTTAFIAHMMVRADPVVAYGLHDVQRESAGQACNSRAKLRNFTKHAADAGRDYVVWIL